MTTERQSLWIMQNRSPRGRALLDRGQARRFQDPQNGRAADAVADVFQRALDRVLRQQWKVSGPWLRESPA
jgi:hypothetical protein